jgi:hypothetical protein
MTAAEGFALVLDRLERCVFLLELLKARVDLLEDRMDQIEKGAKSLVDYGRLH